MPNSYVQVISKAYSASIGGGTRNIFNVYNFKRTTTVNLLDKTHIETAFQTAIMTPVLAALSVSYTQTSNTVRYIEDPNDAPQSFTQAGVGARTGDRAPDYVAGTIQLKTGVRGRFARGSKHYGPIAESDTTGDLIETAAQVRFNSCKTAIVAGFTDSDGNIWVSVVLSHKPPASYVGPIIFVVANQITSGLLNLSLGTMRRRKVKTVN